MHHEPEQLTASLQTPPGKGGIAVVSLAGEGWGDVLEDVFRSRNGQAFSDTSFDQLHLGNLMDGEEILDEAVVALSPRGAEINIHGGPMTARRVLRRLAELGATVKPGRDDAPFEPSHPRWRNPAVGRELQIALPDAPSLLAASVLTNQWSAGLSKLAREILDAPALAPDAADRLLAAADAFRTTRRLLQPPEVVLAGPPNAGKSTLTNALVGRCVSIVHSRAGTTRDWVRHKAILAGRCVYLTDTAGLWETDHPVEAESVRRAWEQIEKADLVLLLTEGDPIELPQTIHTQKILHVQTKRDRPTAHPGAGRLKISAQTGEGIPELTQAVLEALGLTDINPATPSAFTPRQESLLRTAAKQRQQNSITWKNTLRELLGEEENANKTNKTE
ncbi:MAG: 50S ribosome-binding GTPase [Phycisphaerae bacterium]|nr:50S ribosome-binding GTPase [Phycisphaerae bacterium]